MPSTRSTSSTEDIISYIDEKFNDELYKSKEELKLCIIDEIQNGASRTTTETNCGIGIRSGNASAANNNTERAK